MARARPRGPAVPIGSSSCEQVILMWSLASHSLRKSIMTFERRRRLSFFFFFKERERERVR